MKTYGRVFVVALAVAALAAGEAWARGPRAGGPGPAAGGTPHAHPGGPAPGAHMGGGPAHSPAPPNVGIGPGAHVTPNPLQQHPGAPPVVGPGPHGPGFGPWQPMSPSRQSNANWSQWQQQAAQVRSQLHNRYENLFTPQWYRDHPYAWQRTHPHADAWAAATWGAVVGWRGATAAQPVYGAGGTVVYEDNATYYVNDAVTASPSDAVSPPPGSGPWLPLGVLTLVAAGQTTSDRAIQLAVAKDGTIGGAYYDAVSGQDVPIQGSVDPQTQRVTWTVGKNRQTVMETTLADLTRDEGPVSVRLGDNQTQDWLMIRLKPQ